MNKKIKDIPINFNCYKCKAKNSITIDRKKIFENLTPLECKECKSINKRMLIVCKHCQKKYLISMFKSIWKCGKCSTTNEIEAADKTPDNQKNNDFHSSQKNSKKNIESIKVSCSNCNSKVYINKREITSEGAVYKCKKCDQLSELTYYACSECNHLLGLSTKQLSLKNKAIPVKCRNCMHKMIILPNKAIFINSIKKQSINKKNTPNQNIKEKKESKKIPDSTISNKKEQVKSESKEIIKSTAPKQNEKVKREFTESTKPLNQNEKVKKEPARKKESTEISNQSLPESDKKKLETKQKTNRVLKTREQFSAAVGDTLMGNAGFLNKLSIQDPERILHKNRFEKAFWSFGIFQESSPNNPLAWNYQLKNPIIKSDTSEKTNTLNQLLSSSINSIVNHTQFDFKTLRQNVEKEINQRGDWMAHACLAIIPIIQKAFLHEDLPENIYRQIQSLLKYIVHIAVGISLLSIDKKDIFFEKKSFLYTIVIHQFLNYLSHPKIFAELFPPDEEIHQFDAYLLKELCTHALTSTPFENSYQWIKYNTRILLNIATNESFPTGLRATIALIIKIHQVYFQDQHNFQSLDEIFFSKEILSEYPDGTFLIKDEEFKKIKPESYVIKSDIDKALWADRLSRLLTKNTTDNSIKNSLNDSATMCLGIENFSVISRCNLFRSYAKYNSNLHGSVKRFLSLLLRTSNSSELYLFLKLRNDCYPYKNSIDNRALFRFLVWVLNNDERKFFFEYAQTSFNINAIKDLSMIKDVILIKLGQWAENDERFFNDYWDVRTENPLPKHTERFMYINSSVLESEISSKLISERKLTIMNSFDTQKIHKNKESLKISNLMPSFLYFQKFKPDITCLLHYHSIPARAIDFFSINAHQSYKRKILKDALMSLERIYILARIEKISIFEGKSIASVNIGTGIENKDTKGVSDFKVIQHQQLEIGHPVERMDSILVKLEKVNINVLILTFARFDLVPYDDKANNVDLRLKNEDPIKKLEQYWSEQKTFHIKGTIRNIITLEQDESKVLCLVDAGFEWVDEIKNKLQYPSFLIPKDDAPEINEEVYIKPYILEFGTDQSGHEYIFKDASNEFLSLLPGTIVSAKLELATKAPKKSHKWKAVIGLKHYTILRRELTSDLRKLSYLDSLTKVDDNMKNLLDNHLQMIVKEDGNLSLVKTPPRWRTHDLILAFLTKQTDQLIFIRKDISDSSLIFEMTSSNISENQNLSRLNIIGEFVKIMEGELTDRLGNPINSSILEYGDRLTINVSRNNSSQSNFTDIENPLTLHVIGEPCRDDKHLISNFRKDNLINVIVKERSPNFVLEFADHLPDWFVKPVINIDPSCDDQYFKRSNVDVIEAIISKNWNPYDESNNLFVSGIQDFSISFRYADPATTIKKLIELDTGSLLNCRRYIEINENSVCFADDLWVDIDPVFPFLLPQKTSLNHLKRYCLNIPIRLNKVKDYPEKNSLKKFKSEQFLKIFSKEKQHSNTQGIIVRKPGRHSPSKKISVRWLLNSYEPSAYPIVSEECVFNIPTNMKYNDFSLGDLIIAKKKGKFTDFFLIRRRYTGNTLFKIVNFNDLTFRVNKIKSSVIKIGDEDIDWIFVMFVDEKPQIVSINSDQIVDYEKLNNIWQLDRVTFQLILKKDTLNNKTTLKVLKIEESPLHKECGSQTKLRILGETYDKRSIKCEYTSQNKENLKTKPLFVLVRKKSFPHIKSFQKGSYLTGTIERFILEYDEFEFSENNPQIHVEFSLKLDFIPFVQKPKKIQKLKQKPDLDEALHKNGGRLEEKAISKRINSDGFLMLKMEHYEHKELIPLSPDEQTWIIHTGKLVRKWKDKVVIFKDDSGNTIASIKRLTPKTLQEWLVQTKRNSVMTVEVQKDYPLFYYGLIDEDQSLEWRITTSDQTDDNTNKRVLFETSPGKCFIAETKHILFKGEPFDPTALKPGDCVTRFEVFERSINGEKGINIQSVFLDICNEFEKFSRRKGIMFARIRLVGSTVKLIEVGGADYNTNPVRSHRLGRWRLRLESIKDYQFEWLTKFDEKEFVYVKFVEADHKSGNLWYRLLDADEVFSVENLVFVRYKSISTLGKDGETYKMDVKPLSKMISKSNENHNYYVPETLFSIRRNILHRINWKTNKMILAKVVEPSKDDKRFNSKRLSFINTPDRSFAYLMNRKNWQGIVKNKPENNKISIEVEESVNVRLPLDRINQEVTSLNRLNYGDILFIDSIPGKYEIQLADIQPGNIDYIDFDLNRTILTQLWGSENYRLNKFNEHKRLNCNLIGYPQLKGVSHINDENLLYSKKTIIQHIINDSRNVQDWIQLEPGIAEDNDVGQLKIDMDSILFKPVDTDNFQNIHCIHVTFHVGTVIHVLDYLKTIQWRNTTQHHARPKECIDNSLIIGTKQNKRISFTKASSSPLPVEHLFEQFSIDITQKGGMEKLTYVIANATNERLILEIAPGRYVELPTILLKSMYPKGNFKNRKMNWECLKKGDKITIKLISISDFELSKYFQNINVCLIQNTPWYRFNSDYITTLRKTETSGLVLGPPGKHCLPADHLYFLLKDQSLELSRFKQPHIKQRKLIDFYEKFGTRLIVEARITNINENNSRILYFCDIGVEYYSPKHNKKHTPIFYLNEKKYDVSDKIDLRILKIVHNNYKIEYMAVEPKSDDNYCRLIYYHKSKKFDRYDGLPETFDSVIVKRDVKGYFSIDGYENYKPRWTKNNNDPLKLHISEMRKRIEPLLLHEDGSFFWATVEKVERREILLSRSIQLEQGLPKNNYIVRAKIKGAIQEYKDTPPTIIVDLMKIPYVIYTENFCFGHYDVGNLFDILKDENEGEGFELEVVLNDDNILSANDVYQLPEYDELEAKIEFVSSTGILVCKDGCRIFVSSKELSYCQLDESLLKLFFIPGNKIILHRDRKNKRIKFSHIQLSDIQEEINQLKKSGGPIYVTIEHVHNENKSAIVKSTRSNFLMELNFASSNDFNPSFSKTSAYLESTDSYHNRIVLSLSAIQSKSWILADIPNKQFAIDHYTPELIKERIKSLIDILYDQSSKGMNNWLLEQHNLEPCPRNIRLIIEQIIYAIDEDDIIFDWNIFLNNDNLNNQRKDANELHKIWKEISTIILNDGYTTDANDPFAIFGAGYWFTIQNNTEKALKLLKKCKKELDEYFDISVVLAKVFQLNNDRRNFKEQIRKLTSLTWTNAMSTMHIYPPEPTEQYFDAEISKEWDEAIRTGDVTLLEEVTKKIKIYEPDSLRSITHELWLSIIKNESELELNKIFNRYIDLLREEEWFEEEIDSLFYVFASKLSFCRGDTLSGWWYLEKCQSEYALTALEVANFWKSWCAGYTIENMINSDSTLKALLPLLKAIRMDKKIQEVYDLFDSFFSEYRDCLHNWRFLIPECQIEIFE